MLPLIMLLCIDIGDPGRDSAGKIGDPLRTPVAPVVTPERIPVPVVRPTVVVTPRVKPEAPPVARTVVTRTSPDVYYATDRAGVVWYDADRGNLDRWVAYRNSLQVYIPSPSGCPPGTACYRPR